MARWIEPTPEQEAGYREWAATRPAGIRELCERFNPWTLYKMLPTGQRVTIYSFGEAADGNHTVAVNITGEFNLLTFERQVFGVSPDDLEECDLPQPGETLGVVLTDTEQADYINLVRATNGLPPMEDEDEKTV